MEEEKSPLSAERGDLNDLDNIPDEILDYRLEEKEISKSLKETDRLLKEAIEIIQKDLPQESKPKQANSLKLQRYNTQEAPQNEVMKSQFWRKTTTWKKRKKMAEAIIANSRHSDEKAFHTLAFRGDIETLISIYDEETTKLFNEDKEINDESGQNSKIEPEEKVPIEELILEKNSLGLTPLIYAIWGEQNRKDEEKKTSKFILGLSNSWLKKKLDSEYDRYIKKSKIPFDFELINELGHAYIHEILNIEEFKKYNFGYSKFNLYNLISEDFDEAVSYCIETQGFKLVKNRFSHEACKAEESISIVAFALRVKSIQCANLLFNHIKKNITKPDFSYMLDVIQSEMSEYLAFNSVIIEELLIGFTHIQEKSLPVNIEKIPKFEMIYSRPNEIDIKAYSHFDDMPEAKDFIKSQIINSKIRLPNVSGSEKSLEFIQRLASTENLMLFRVTLIKSYLQFKWEKMWPMIFFQSLLMWVNIPLIVMLVFVDKYNFSVLISFTVINGILTVYEVFQFASMDLFKYLGNIDQIHACLGMRLVTLFLIFLPNFQPYSCSIYLCISACAVQINGEKKNIFICLLIFGGIVGLFFPAFWVGWEYTHYLMMGVGGFIFLSSCVLMFSKNGVFYNLFLRMIEVPLLVVVIFMKNENFAILILTQFITGAIFFTQIKLSRNARNLIRLLFDLLTVSCFSVNFLTIVPNTYNILNYVALLSATISIFTMVKTLYTTNQTSNNSIPILFILISAILIGFNLEDSIPLKFFIIVLEFSQLFLFAMLKLVNLIKILKEFLSMIFNWNSFDLGRIVICGFWLYYQFSSKTNLALTYCFVALILIRGLTGFRCFKMTRYYVRLILNSIHDILPFILIFFYSTLSFGIICSIYRDISISEIWMYPYDLNIGAASHDNTFDINYLSFIIATVINVIIMLNLLISILGDSFDRFQVSALEIDFMEMAQTLAEFETMLFWRRNKGDSGLYLVGILNEAKGKKRQGKITRDEFFELKDVVATMKDNLDKQFEVSEKKVMTRVQEMFEESEEKLFRVKKEIVEVVEQKIGASEKRVIAAVERLMNRK